MAARDTGKPAFLVAIFFGGITDMDDKTNETLDIESAAKFLQLTKWRIYQLTRKNEIPCHRPTGRKIIFFKEELMQFVQGKKSALARG
jgi:excisionase family DNA binding protein